MVQNTKQGCGDDDADQKGLGRGTVEEKLAEFIISWRARIGGAGILTNLVSLSMSRNDVADYLGLSDVPQVALRGLLLGGERTSRMASEVLPRCCAERFQQGWRH